MSRFFYSLGFKLMVLVLLAVLPVMGWTLWEFTVQYRHAREEAQKDLLQLVRHISVDFEQSIELIKHLLFAAAQIPAVSGNSNAKCNEVLSVLSKGLPFCSNVGACDANGNMFCSALPFTPPVSGADRLFFQRVIKTGHFSSGDLQLGRLTGKYTIHFGHPVLNEEGRLDAVVFASLQLSWLNQLAAKIRLPAGSNLTVVDIRGAILSRHPEPEKWVGRVFPDVGIIREVLHKREGVAEVPGIDGANKIYAFRPLGGGMEDVFIYVGLPVEFVFAETKQALARNLMALGVVALLGLCAAWVLSSLFVMRPVRVLVGTTGEIAAGNLAARTSLKAQAGEIGQLGMAFDRMSETLQQRETLQKQAEADLKEALVQVERIGHQHELILTSAWEGIFGLDLDGNHTFVNPSAARMLGYEVHELVGKHSHSTWHHSKPDGCPYPEEDCPIYSTLKDGKIHHIRDEVFWRKDGSSFVAECMSSPIVEKGNIVGAVVSFIDVTEPRKARQELLETSERLELALNGGNLGLVDWHIPSNRVVLNKRVAGLLGYSQDEVEPTFGSLQELVHPDDRAYFAKVLNDHLEGQTPMFEGEFRAKAKSGEWRWLMARGRVVERDKEGKPIRGVGTYLDCTNRKYSEQALRESEQKNALLIEESPVGIGIIQDDRCAYANPALTQILGIENPDEIIDRSPVEYVVAEDAELMRQMIVEVLGGKKQPLSYEFRGQRKDGKHFDIVLWPRQIDYLGAEAILCFVADRTEERSLRAQLLQAQKMEAIGTLAGGIAHDFNNMLFAIVGYTELALSRVPQETQLGDYLEKILAAARRSGDMVKQILAFSRQSQLDKQPISLGPIVKEGIKLLRASIPTSIEIRQRIQPDLGKVLGDPTQIHQVLINICTNAVHAMWFSKGILSVDLTAVELDSDFVAQYSAITSGKYISLTVGDTGHGIPSDVLDRIFEPYFSTKKPGEGTGLGLSVVHGIVKEHGGIVTVYSAPDRGSTFHVYFPVIEDECVSGTVQDEKPVPSGHERILLVDDEEMLTELGRSILEGLDYDVVTTTSPIQALEIFRAERDRFDLVITDLTMPKMAGDELAREILAIRPEIPIIGCTGFSLTISEEDAKAAGIRILITKPILRKDLAETVRHLLDEKTQKEQ